MKNIMLFFGEEKLLIKEEIDKIKQKIVPDYLEAVNCIPIDGKNILEDELLNVCNIVPMMETKKLVVVYDARFFQSGKNRQKVSPKKQDFFIDSLKNIPERTYLIFTSEKVDKRKKIYKMIKSKGTVREFKITSIKNKAIWIQKRAGNYGKSMDLKSAYFIANNIRDLYQADNELKKMVNFVGEKPKIEQKDILFIFSKSLEGNIFDVMDCIGMKNPTGAVKIINHLLELGENGVGILYMISKHMMDIITIKSMKGLSFNETKDKSGLHPFVVKKALGQSRNFALAELEKSLLLCQQLDLDIKTGKITEKIGLELLVTNLCQ